MLTWKLVLVRMHRIDRNTKRVQRLVLRSGLTYQDAKMERRKLHAQVSSRMLRRPQIDMIPERSRGA